MVEIIPKQAPERPSITNILFGFSLIAAILVLVAFFVLSAYVKDGQNKLADLQTALAQFESPDNAALKQEILLYQKRLDNFGQLIKQHQAVSRAFGFIENNTHPDVWFGQFESDIVGRQIRLAGKAKNFESLGQQMIMLKDELLFDGIQLEGVAMNPEGGADFSIIITLNGKVFQFQ